MLLTQLEYFVAVAREQHFGRAAAASFVSQSALSEAIRKLESELGTPLVNRGRAFESLTPEGERVLVWAQRMLADHRSLRDELAANEEHLAGGISVGVIPSAIAGAAQLVSRLSVTHPLLHAKLVTGLSSEEIIDRIRRYDLDAGLIHPSVEDNEDITIAHVADEAIVIVANEAVLTSAQHTMTAAELAELPLCLLEPDMRGRQILDRRLAEHGVVLAPRIEADSVDELIALVRSGPWASAVTAGAIVGSSIPGVRVIELVEPQVTLSIVLAVRGEEPRSPLARAILGAAQQRS